MEIREIEPILGLRQWQVLYSRSVPVHRLYAGGLAAYVSELEHPSHPREEYTYLFCHMCHDSRCIHTATVIERTKYAGRGARR